ncbi:MAG: hypothetical protein JNJ90_06035 [Saprospiraceae bacterium]|nr:hypothetical protein [Saprospiraceae bacterium]
MAILLAMLPALLCAQHPIRIGTLSKNDGLGFRKVNAIAQDSRGLIWLGTSQGLERYDGHSFVRLGNNKQADYFFPGGEVSDESLQVLNDSTFWLIADGKLYSFAPFTFQAKDISSLAGVKGVFCALKKGSDGKIWAVVDDDTRQYLLCCDNTGRFRCVARSPHIRQPFTSIAPDNAGNVWWSTIADGLRLYDPEGQLLHAVKPDSNIWFGTKMYFTEIFADSRGRVFVFPKSKKEIWQYDPQRRSHTVLVKNMDGLTYVACEDRNGNLWFSQLSGLLCWNKGEGTSWTDFTPDIRQTMQFSAIHAMLEDQAGLIWVTTDNGLFKIPAGHQVFQSHFSEPGARWGNGMRGIFQDTSGNIFFYCETGPRGLYRLDTRSGSVQLIDPFGNPHDPHYGLPNAQMFIVDEKTNSAWTMADRLVRINLHTGKGTVAAEITDKTEIISRNPIIRLRNGCWLLGKLLDKLTLVDVATGAQQKVPLALNSEDKAVKVTCFLENPDGSIWVGTTGGLFRIRPDGTLLERFSTTSVPALGSDHLLALHADNAGRLWIGTFGGGLNCLETNSNSGKRNLRIFTQRNGLCDDNVASILEDDAGNIWSGTYNGLACYRTRSGVFQNFFEEDGLPSNEFNYASALKDRDGLLWFGGMNGVVVFDPEATLTIPKNPPIVLTYFSRYNARQGGIEKSHLLPAEYGSLPFVIRPDDAWFEFGWALPNYMNPSKNQYRVWLEGLEEHWNFIGGTPLVRYNHLPPGSYTLHIKGADSKGNPGVNELKVPIVVRPYFYQTWWFFLLVLALVAAIVYYAVRFRYLRRLEMEQLRTRIAGDLHDEVGSMLAGLAMQADLLAHQSTTDKAQAGRVGEISRAAMSKMRDLVWGLDSRRDRVRNLLERMQEQAAELLGPAGIAFRFELGSLPLEKKIPVDVRQNLYLIFKEALTNVVRHSTATEVRVRFGYFEESFELSIYDNGVPTQKQNPARISTGLGLSNMEMRARAIGCSFSAGLGESGFGVRVVGKGV